MCGGREGAGEGARPGPGVSRALTASTSTPNKNTGHLPTTRALIGRRRGTVGAAARGGRGVRTEESARFSSPPSPPTTPRLPRCPPTPQSAAAPIAPRCRRGALGGPHPFPVPGAAGCPPPRTDRHPRGSAAPPHRGAAMRGGAMRGGAVGGFLGVEPPAPRFPSGRSRRGAGSDQWGAELTRRHGDVIRAGKSSMAESAPCRQRRRPGTRANRERDSTPRRGFTERTRRKEPFFF